MEQQHNAKASHDWNSVENNEVAVKWWDAVSSRRLFTSSVSHKMLDRLLVSPSYSVSLTQWVATPAVFHPFCRLPVEMGFVGTRLGKGFLGFQREKLHLSWDENRNISIFWFPGSRRLLLFIPMYSYTDSLYVFSSVQPTGAVVRFSCRTVAIQALHLCCAMRRRGGHLQMLSGMLTLFVWRCVALTMCGILLLYVWNSISLGDCIISVTQLPPQH